MVFARRRAVLHAGTHAGTGARPCQCAACTTCPAGDAAAEAAADRGTAAAAAATPGAAASAAGSARAADAHAADPATAAAHAGAGPADAAAPAGAAVTAAADATASRRSHCPCRRRRPVPPAPQSATSQPNVTKNPAPNSQALENTLEKLRQLAEQKQPPKARYNPQAGGAAERRRQSARQRHRRADRRRSAARSAITCARAGTPIPGMLDLDKMQVLLTVTTDATGVARQAVVAPRGRRAGSPATCGCGCSPSGRCGRCWTRIAPICRCRSTCWVKRTC